MDEYNRLLNNLKEYLNYERVINNEDVINAYDYINLLRKEYNKTKKVNVSDEVVSRIDRGLELILKRECKDKKDIEYIESIEVFTGKISKIRIITSVGESFICRNNDTKEIYTLGRKLNQKFMNKYLVEFNRLFDASEEYLKNHKDEFNDIYNGVVISHHEDETISIDIIYDSETGVHYDIKFTNDPTNTKDKEWLTRKSLKEIIDLNETSILKRLPINIKDLPPLGIKVTKRYKDAYRQMRLNKKMFSC